MDSSIERRNFPGETRVEKRDGGESRIFGHAALFDTRSQNLGGFYEQIQRGAFVDTIRTDDIRALFNHDPNHVLGRNKSGTLALSEDTRGLAYQIIPPDTQGARDLLESIQRGDVSGNSFSFTVLPDGQRWAEDKDGTLIRTIIKAKLYDVGPVTFPAYMETDISLRSILDQGRRMLGKGDAHWQTDIRRRRLDLIVRTMDPEQRALYDIQLLRAQRHELQARYGR